jgi:hypothetical protein
MSVLSFKRRAILVRCLLHDGLYFDKINPKIRFHILTIYVQIT